MRLLLGLLLKGFYYCWCYMKKKGIKKNVALTNWSPQGTVAWMRFWLEFNLIGHKSSRFWFTFCFSPVYQIHDNQVFIFLYWTKYLDMSVNRNIPLARWPCSSLRCTGNWFNVSSLPINWVSFWATSVRFSGNWLAWLFSCCSILTARCCL